MKAPGLRYPDLYCIGAQKGATTWLQVLLGAHPQTWVPPIKELYYFNQLHIPRDAEWAGRRRLMAVETAIQARRERLAPGAGDDDHIRLLRVIGVERPDDAWYGQVYAHAGPTQLCAEVDPSYSLLPEAGIQHMRRLSGDCHILLIMRDPIERAWSQVRMLLREGQVPDATTAIRRRPDIVGFSRYSATLRRYHAVFPSSSIRALSHDSLEADPQRFVTDLLLWLGLSTTGYDTGRVTQRHHVGQEMEIDQDAYAVLREALADEYDDLAEFAPESVSAWRQRHYG